MASLMKFYPAFIEIKNLFSNYYQKEEGKKETNKEKDFQPVNSSYETSVCLLLKTDEDTNTAMVKDDYRALSLMNKDGEVFNEKFTNQF